MKEILIDLLAKQLKKLNADLDVKEINEVLRVPPSNDLGDFSFPCFSYLLAVFMRLKTTAVLTT